MITSSGGDAVRGELTAYEHRNCKRNFLRHNRASTRLELSQIFKVSLVTIHRDICFLTRVAPIVTRDGNGGEVFYIDSKEDTIQYLTIDEALCLEHAIKVVDEADKLIIQNIIYKYSIPKPTKIDGVWN